MPNKMERFTQRARHVLMLAQEEAEGLQHDHIGPEHLLLGLLREEGSVARHVLLTFKVDVETVRSGLDQGSRAGQGNLDLTQDTKRVLEFAVDEARRMSHHYIGTEHLLLGMLRKPNAALTIFTQMDIKADDLRAEVRSALQQTPEVDDAPAEPEQDLMNIAKLRETHIGLMQHTLATLGHVLDGITQEEATTWRDQSSTPSGWTVLEVLCHLADFNEIFYLRAQMILKEHNPSLPAYDHDQMAIDEDYNGQDKTEVYARLSASRAEFVSFFQNLDETLWSRAGIHPERGRFSLMDALVQVGTHEAGHLEQITRIIRERKA